MYSLELRQIACYPTQEEARESEDEGLYEIISNTPRTSYVSFVSTPDEDHYCPMADLQPAQITAPLVEAVPGTTLRRSSNAVVPTDKPSLKNLKKNLDRPMPPPKPSKFRSEPTDDDKGKKKGSSCCCFVVVMVVFLVRCCFY